MPWCPVCKNEYGEGIKLCAECKVELVERLEDEKKSDELSEQEKIARVRAMLAEEQGGQMKKTRFRRKCRCIMRIRTAHRRQRIIARLHIRCCL